MADMPASLAQVYCSAPVTVLLWPHTTQGANLAENEHSGKIQQNPHLANTAFIVPCMLWKKHEGDKHIYLPCRNTKHKGASFPPLTGKGYFLSVAVHIIVKLQHKLLTLMGCL